MNKKPCSMLIVCNDFVGQGDDDCVDALTKMLELKSKIVFEYVAAFRDNTSIGSSGTTVFGDCDYVVNYSPDSRNLIKISGLLLDYKKGHDEKLPDIVYLAGFNLDRDVIPLMFKLKENGIKPIVLQDCCGVQFSGEDGRIAIACYYGACAFISSTFGARSCVSSTLRSEFLE